MASVFLLMCWRRTAGGYALAAISLVRVSFSNCKLGRDAVGNLRLPGKYQGVRAVYSQAGFYCSSLEHLLPPPVSLLASTNAIFPAAIRRHPDTQMIRIL